MSKEKETPVFLYIDRDSELAVVYNELRRLAGQYLRQERPGNTLQATALVHEAYLRLRNQADGRWEDRNHFFATAAQIMRRILVDHARMKVAEKRGGAQEKLQLDEALVFSPEQSNELTALDEALERLAKIDPRQSRIVELRFFGGLSVEQIAAILQTSPRTVKRDWSVARAWLYGELQRG